MKTTTPDTTKMDRKVLDATKGITEALYAIGAMSDEDAAQANEIRAQVGAKPLKLERNDLRNFDESTLTPTLAPEAIKALRQREGASQAVLARYVGASTATVSQWERGTRKPDGPALKLLGLAERHGLEYIR